MKLSQVRRPKGHPGFKAVEAKIAARGGVRNPGAVLAADARKASPAAKAANPNLRKVATAGSHKGAGGKFY